MLGMMQLADIEQLVALRPESAVSILMPLERGRPQNLEDPRRFDALVELAFERLAATEEIVDRVLLGERLRAAREEIESHLEHPGDGLALFVTGNESKWMSLPFPVPERVVVGRAFVVRDLLEGVQDQTPLLVLLLSQEESRLLLLDGNRLCPTGKGFPLRVEAPHELDSPHRDLPIHENAHEEARFVFRAVDRALAAIDPTLPVVVVAPERDLSLFREVSHHRDRIVGTVTGNHLHTAPAHLLEIIEPAHAAFRAQRRATAIGDFEDALDAGRVATDPLEVWRAAHDGRGHLLLVERGYELHGEPTDDHFEWVDAESGAAPDAVEAIVEAVLDHAGQVVFTDEGELPAGVHLGLVLRY